MAITYIQFSIFIICVCALLGRVRVTGSTLIQQIIDLSLRRLQINY